MSVIRRTWAVSHFVEGNNKHELRIESDPDNLDQVNVVAFDPSIDQEEDEPIVIPMKLEELETLVKQAKRERDFQKSAASMVKREEEEAKNGTA